MSNMFSLYFHYLLFPNSWESGSFTFGSLRQEAVHGVTGVDGVGLWDVAVHRVAWGGWE